MATSVKKVSRKKPSPVIKKSSPKKAVAKKVSPRKAPVKKAAVTKKRTGTKKPAASGRASSRKSAASKQPPAASILPRERYQLIAERAYLRAEQRGFIGGDPTQDWLEAEKEIDEILNPK